MSPEEQAALKDAMRILQERNARLEAALKPFGEALKLHHPYMGQPSKFKQRICLSLGLVDWRAVADVLGIDLTPKQPQETEEVSQQKGA